MRKRPSITVGKELYHAPGWDNCVCFTLSARGPWQNWDPRLSGEITHPLWLTSFHNSSLCPLLIPLRIVSLITYSDLNTGVAQNPFQEGPVCSEAPSM